MSERARAVRSADLVEAAGSRISDGEESTDSGALERLKSDVVLDGELVALDQHGVSRFQLLQNALRHEAKLLFCVFDLMFCDGKDLRGLPLIERKKRLRSLLPRHPLLLFSRHRKQHGNKFAEAERKGLEGIMAKRPARYCDSANSARPRRFAVARR